MNTKNTFLSLVDLLNRLLIVYSKHYRIISIIVKDEFFVNLQGYNYEIVISYILRYCGQIQIANDYKCVKFSTKIVSLQSLKPQAMM